MKKIKIYEMFSGLGSQYFALKKLQKKLNFQAVSLGACDFYIDAIISYMIIHYGKRKPEKKLSKEKMAALLQEHTFSSDSKSIVSKNYFLKMKNQRIREIFPYLYAFTNNLEFNNEDKQGWNSTDIRKISKIPNDIDILTYSFPCQDLSQQGKQKGLKKGTRSGLLYEIERILKNNLENLPKVLLLENVKALTSNKFKKDFLDWIDVLDQIGYKTTYKVLNSAHHGSAQNRERVFAVSILKNLNTNFLFKKYKRRNKKLNQIIKNDEHMI